MNFRCVIASLTALFITLLDVLVVSVTPYLFSLLIRHYHTLSTTYLIGLVMTIATCWFLKVTAKRFRSLFFFPVINQAIRTVRLRLITHYHRTTRQESINYQSHEILSAATRISMSVRATMKIVFISLLPAFLKLASCIAALYYFWDYSWLFLLAVLTTSLFFYPNLYRFIQTRRKMWEITDEVMINMGHSLQQGGFAKLHPEVEKKRMTTLFDKEATACQKENRAHHTLYLIQHILFFFVMAPFFGVLIYQLKIGVIDLPRLILIKSYMLTLNRQVFQVSDYFRNLSARMVDMQKVIDILSLPTDTMVRNPSSECSTENPTTDMMIRLEDVSFNYAKHPEQKILWGLNLTIRRGEKIAIIGKSGSGKSTLAHLIAGIYLPTQGQIFFQEQSTQNLHPATIGKTLYFMEQEEKATDFALPDSFPEVGEDLLPPDLKTKLTQKKSFARWSSGEKQRILLARCLYYKPGLALFDESLSFLDYASAEKVISLLFQHIPTIVFITHRKSLLEKFDIIYELVDGRLCVYSEKEKTKNRFNQGG